MHFIKNTILMIGVAAVAPLAMADGSPWLPGAGTTTLSANLTSGSTRDFFIGEESSDLLGELDGTYLWLNASHGYNDIWAFDIRVGYASTNFDSDLVEGSSLDSQDELADTTVGVSYQFINEFEADNGFPTISARLGYTAGGDYDPDVLVAIGDGASGFDLSLLVGKAITPSIAIFGDLTLRQRDGDVPNGVKYLLSGYYTSPIRGLGFQLALAGVRTDGDLNIGDPGVTFDQLSETDRDSDFLVGGVNYGFNNGIGLGLSYTALIDGRNIADTDVVNASVSYSF